VSRSFPNTGPTSHIIRAHDQKTIEGDLFKAFVAAGAISKANADDPKKSSFVRCARTDKGVHAAGNIISLKLIVEDKDVVKQINEHLPSQIRVWGYERTNNSFSAYQLCDSRIYEYLIPTHSFLPPHPSSFLGRKTAELAKENNDEDAWRERQEEVEQFWAKVDDEHINPILDGFDDKSRAILQSAQSLMGDQEDLEDVDVRSESATKKLISRLPLPVAESLDKTGEEQPPGKESLGGSTKGVDDGNDVPKPAVSLESNDPRSSKQRTKTRSPISEGFRQIRAAYVTAKRSYRISPSRLGRVRRCLAMYEGTRNYHNFTVQKGYRDPSAKRVIKSFVVNGDPILIGGTEWLSLKVHGQSFMMHQIRKMVGMVALVVRCGCDPNRIVEAYGDKTISIPKAPSLGLLLERPIFDTYNKRAKSDLGKETLDFGKYETEMEHFKAKEIYERIYRDEEQCNM
jgi:tRNA pseudouridine38-40 synthase